MKIKILGTRGEVEPSTAYHSRHSGILIDKALLLDLGEKEFLKYKPKYILLTHLHPDHAFFITEPVKQEIRIPIYTPEAYKNGIKVIVLKKKIVLGSYKITPIPTHHSQKVKSQAYLTEKGGQKLLYTGDLIWINKKYHHLFKDLDLVITEASFKRKGGMIRRDKDTGKIYGHTGVPNLIRLFSRFTQNIILLHFGTWFYNQGARQARRELLKLGKENSVNVYPAYDGMEINNFGFEK